MCEGTQQHVKPIADSPVFLFFLLRSGLARTTVISAALKKVCFVFPPHPPSPTSMVTAAVRVTGGEAEVQNSRSPRCGYNLDTMCNTPECDTPQPSLSPTRPWPAAHGGKAGSVKMHSTLLWVSVIGTQHSHCVQVLTPGHLTWPCNRRKPVSAHASH